jgi:hypothetical protein
MNDYLTPEYTDETSTTLFKHQGISYMPSFDERLKSVPLRRQNPTITRVKIIDSNNILEEEASYFTEDYDLVSKFKVEKRYKVKGKLVRRELYKPRTIID